MKKIALALCMMTACLVAVSSSQKPIQPLHGGPGAPPECDPNYPVCPPPNK